MPTKQIKLGNKCVYFVTLTFQRGDVKANTKIVHGYNEMLFVIGRDRLKKYMRNNLMDSAAALIRLSVERVTHHNANFTNAKVLQ